jgi:hypothetical protein
MATSKAKRTVSLAQLQRSNAHASGKTASPKPQTSTRKHRSPKKPRKRERLPPSLRFTETRRGKTTIRRFSGRSFYRFEEVKGKIVDFAEVYTAGDYHAIDVRFQDKTALHFVIDPGFTLDTEYCDWKTGDLRRIKRWPLIHSQTLRA